MKFEPVQNKLKPFSPLTCAADCGCSPVKSITSADITSEFKNETWFTGVIDSPAGPVPQVSTEIKLSERMAHIRSRASSFRMKFSLKPGLYAVGSPASTSDIFVTANYRLSFDHLRKALKGMNAWILVLDTAGINVWCAAGKGTFGTDELIRRIKLTGIEKYVEHKRLILPQLGAPGVNSGEVREKTGFRISYGPVRAEDITQYIEKGYEANEEMRLVKFTMKDRAVLIPMEINMIKEKFLYFISAALLYSALQPEGIIFKDALTSGYSLITACIITVAAGAVFTPLLLPFIPFRSFAIKGGISGAAALLVTEYSTGLFSSISIYFYSAVLILFTLISSYIALQFTGATTYTSLSGVKREIKYSLPVYIAGFFVSSILFIISKISEWGYL
ncbi:MAG TPA: mercury methylation corrinoid protein HgcA [Spirochaetota bacterium]|nr:mercury methylation corrinoid protein HgcA [Spirochaetota bacterium]